MLLPIQLNLQPLAQVAWLQVAPARTLTAAAGAFALTGVAAGLSQGGSPASAQVSWLQVAPVRTLTASPGAFTLTGVAAGLLAGGSAQAWVSWLQLAPAGAGAYTLAADPGAFVVSVAPSLSDYVLTASPGAFGLTGRDAALTKGGTPVVVGYTLTAAAGAFVVTGRAATLRWSPVAVFTAAPGTWRVDNNQARVGSPAIRPGTVRVGGAIINRS